VNIPPRAPSHEQREDARPAGSVGSGRRRPGRPAGRAGELARGERSLGHRAHRGGRFWPWAPGFPWSARRTPAGTDLA